MALNAYLKLKGETQGDINGSVTQAGRENKIEVYAFRHGVKSPRDAASGLPTGKRQHEPFSVLKPTDKASPLLYKALVDNENVTEWKLNCWKPSSSGKELNYYDVILTNANVCAMETEMRNNKDPNQMKYEICDTARFTYQKIEWVYVDGGISAEDDWETPVA
jgi:type VI secretion system secreted protein Hcp